MQWRWFNNLDSYIKSILQIYTPLPPKNSILWLFLNRIKFQIMTDSPSSIANVTKREHVSVRHLFCNLHFNSGQYNKFLPVADPLPPDAVTAILNGVKDSFILCTVPATRNCMHLLQDCSDICESENNFFWGGSAAHMEKLYSQIITWGPAHGNTCT